MKARNPTLYRNLRQFTEEAINLIQEKAASPNDIPTRPASKLKSEKEGVWSIEEVEKPEWGLLVRLQGSHLVQLDSYTSCMRLLQGDTVISSHLDKLVGIQGGSASKVQTSQILPRFITSLLSQSASLSPNQEQFDTLYKRVENFFYSPQLNVRLIAPLINVKGPHQPTLLTDDVYIVPNSDDRLEQWISDTSEGTALVPWRTVPGLTHSLEHRFSAPKVIVDATQSSAEETPAQVGESSLAVAVNRIRRMVSALRLLKPDYIDIPFIKYDLLEWHPNPLEGRQAPLYPPHWRTFGSRYVIRESDVPEIAVLYRGLSQEVLTKHRFIKVAVHRIERSVEETEPTECLVDLVIALEAVLFHGFGKEEERGEKRFRFSIHGAYLLSNEPQERKKIFKQLREAYDLRSRVVHGGEPPAQIRVGTQEFSTKEFVGIVGTMARQIIRQILELACKPNAPEHLVSWNDLVLGFPPTPN